MTTESRMTKVEWSSNALYLNRHHRSLFIVSWSLPVSPGPEQCLFLGLLLASQCRNTEPAVRAHLERYFATWSSQDMEGYGACFHPQARISFCAGHADEFGRARPISCTASG